MWTTAEGTYYQIIYAADSGKQILTDTQDDIFYLDGDYGVDEFFRGTTELGNKYLFPGDTSGDDAGIDTKVTVHLNDMRFLVGFSGAEAEDYGLVILTFDEDGFEEDEFVEGEFGEDGP